MRDSVTSNVLRANSLLQPFHNGTKGVGQQHPEHCEKANLEMAL